MKLYRRAAGALELAQTPSPLQQRKGHTSSCQVQGDLSCQTQHLIDAHVNFVNFARASQLNLPCACHAAVSPIAESPEAQSDGTPSTASPAAAAATPLAQRPAPASPLAAGIGNEEETFHSPLPLPDLRAPDEALYASPESQPAASPAAGHEPPPSPTAPAPDLAFAADGAAVASPAGVEAAAAQLAAVSLVAPEEEELPAVAVAAPPLQQLLRLCGQPTDVEALPSMTKLLEGELLQLHNNI